MKILYWVSEDWYFVSHRLRLALQAKGEGHEVFVVTSLGRYRKLLESNGLNPIHLGINRAGKNVFQDLLTMFRLWRIYRDLKPDVVHHVAVKPVIYGSIVAGFCRVPRVINALAGLGYVYSSQDKIARFLRPIVSTLFKSILNRRNSRLIVQNDDDYARFTHDLKLSKDRVCIIKGAGIDVSKFVVNPEPAGIIRVVLLARLLGDKGVYDFVEAAFILRGRDARVEMVLVGDIDSSNPSSVGASEIRRWQGQGLIKWDGFQANIQAVWDFAHISVLPSYREGLPKSLLESSACGRPMIATDVPGCREVVDGSNGILVPVRTPSALADAIELLANDKELRIEMGIAARCKVEREFSSHIVDRATLDLYVS